MKILPDYLIEYMPYIEEALEELRLSVLEHAYDLLRCLDIYELTSDDLRHKLELYDIQFENMSEAWLPNSRFYRIYPEIKHNRTRHNAIKSIVQSGGQFEGLWSTGFSSKSEYNFKDIQILRHYSIGSAYDGYFYVSGNTYLKDGIAESDAIQALQTDILMNQALPAGYTYLYMPWPRPSYPGDSHCFYNVHMLDFDRLFSVYDNYSTVKVDLISYAAGARVNAAKAVRDSFGYSLKTSLDIIDGLPYTVNTYGNHSFIENAKSLLSSAGVKAIFTVASVNKYPASMYYHWDTGEDTPFRTSYWFDYHYINPYNVNQWPLYEHGTYLYLNKDTGELKPLTSIRLYYNRNNHSLLGTKYILDDNCKILNSTDTVYQTKCYRYARQTTPFPNRSQVFTPKSLLDDHYVEYTIDNNFTSDSDVNTPPGTYKFSHLGKDLASRRSLFNHFKEYVPVWNENRIFADLSASSSYGSDLNPDNPKPNSLYYWLKLKTDKSSPYVDPNSSTTINNDPSVSDITFGNYDRPSLVVIRRPIVDDSPVHLAALTEDSITEYKGKVIEQLVPSRPSREFEFIDSQNMIIETTIDREVGTKLANIQYGGHLSDPSYLYYSADMYIDGIKLPNTASGVGDLVGSLYSIRFEEEPDIYLLKQSHSYRSTVSFTAVSNVFSLVYNQYSPISVSTANRLFRHSELHVMTQTTGSESSWNRRLSSNNVINVYTSTSTSSPLLYQTPDSTYNLYSRSEQTVNGTNWFSVRLIQNGVTLTGYVNENQQDLTAPWPRDYGVDSYNNYMALDFRRLEVTDVGSEYVGGYIYNGNTNEADNANTLYASITWSNHTFVSGDSTGNNVFYSSDGKLYLKAVDAPWSTVNVGDSLMLKATPIS